MGVGCAGIVRDTESSYTVQPGDTLYSIAWRHDIDFHDLARWNHVGSDFRINIGEKLLLRPAAGDTAVKIGSVPHTGSSPKPGAALKPVPQVSKAPPNPQVVGLKWGWPTDRLAAPIPVPSGGVLLPGRLGQDNRAAASGRVVYNGNGIRGYGNLIIIKHSDAVLTAYAHNRESLVHEGQEVALGQLIGHMGEGAPGKPVLYFEIRLNGKPVEPLPVLNAIK